MHHAPSVQLNDGHRIPQLGLGVWRIADDAAAGCVKTALNAGYRSIDTAAIYKNEVGVGRGIKGSGVPRKDLFVTTKVWNDDQGYDETLQALDKSLERLNLEYVDLYLIHWPCPRKEKYVATFKAMIEAQKVGKIRSVGVCNFNQDHLEHLLAQTGVVPAVNQIELHPLLQQPALRAFHKAQNIHTESWSPLSQGKILGHPSVAAISRKYNKTAAQIVLRWHIQLGLIVIPKSATPNRIEENIQVFDFQLDEADLRVLLALDVNERIGPDPERF